MRYDKPVVVEEQMTPGEYELFYAMAHLWSTGLKEMRQRDILHFVNGLRKEKGMKRLSWENFHYHLSKLVKKPFVEKNGSLLSLKPGLYKIVRPAPMCLLISDSQVVGVMCVYAPECDNVPFSKECKLFGNVK